jgi:hypothetical protein
MIMAKEKKREMVVDMPSAVWREEKNNRMQRMEGAVLKRSI